METFDLLIIGAGVSGIGAGCHLTRNCPHLSFAILEGRDSIGGTWDLFRYPGVRSDSDMFTFGYSFRPWQGTKALADGESIRNYVRDTAREYGVDGKIRFRHRMLSADWSSKDRLWRLEVERTAEDGSREVIALQCRFLITATSYYDYEKGYMPDFDGLADYRGRLVHPQQWPVDLDYSGKKVVVIGSGATAVTLVPAMAGRAAHVTMLQRSPSYVLSRPLVDPVGSFLQKILPARIAWGATRWVNILLSIFLYKASRRWPQRVRGYLRRQAQRELGEVPAAPHFDPDYNPWDQRLCLVPDADLFHALRDGSASIVTDRIARFTETGVALESGRHLEADLVVPATGLVLQFLGGAEMRIDGRPLDSKQLVNYRGMMFGGVPNMAALFGYTNNTWTLKIDLTCDYLCRLFRHMRENGYDTFTPRLDRDLQTEPLIGLESGYVRRARDILPRQGHRPPWRNHQNYLRDLLTIRFGRFDDGVMTFTRADAGCTRLAGESG